MVNGKVAKGPRTSAFHQGYGNKDSLGLQGCPVGLIWNLQNFSPGSTYVFGTPKFCKKQTSL